MPTSRPRHQITETPAIERAIDRAAVRWPDESRSKLLVRVITAGSEALDETGTRRRAAISGLAGRYGSIYPTGYLAQLRADWPE